METDYNGGDFSIDPWFLKSWHEQFAEWGMPLARRQRALIGLRRVYTTEVAKKMMMTPATSPIVAALFHQGWPGMVMSALQVGLDLAEVAPVWDEHMFSRLCNLKEFYGSKAELHVWANLLRAGRPCYRSPRGPLDTFKSPDFATRLNGKQYIIEVKATPQSARDVLSRQVEEVMLHGDMMLKGHTVTLLPSKWVRDRLSPEFQDEIRANVDKLRKGFLCIMRKVAARADPAGRHMVGRYGYIDIEASEDESTNADCQLILPLNEREEATRIVRLVMQCNEQIRAGAGVGVAFIDTGNVSNATMIQLALEKAVRERPSRFRKVDFVCLRYSWKDLAGSLVYSALPIGLAGRRLTDAESRLCNDLSV